MDVNEIVNQYKAGKKLQEIAEVMGCTKQRIDQILAKQGIDRRPRGKVTPELIDQIKTLAEAGETNKAISNITGLSEMTVGKVIRENGIERKEREYRCSQCGGTDSRPNGKSGKVCKPCSAKRAREYYAAHGKIEREIKRSNKTN